MYTFLLKFETQEQVKDCMTKWTKHFYYNIQMEQQENMLKFMLYFNLKENFYKIMFGGKRQENFSCKYIH